MASVDSSDGVPLFGVIGAWAREDGRLVIIDGGNHRVLICDGATTCNAVGGGRGEGPGEFERLSYGALVSGDSVLIWDGALRRATVFAPEGHLVRTYGLASSPEAPWAAVVGVYHDGSIMANGLVGSAGPPPEGRHVLESPVYHFSSTGEYLGTTGVYETDEMQFIVLDGGGFMAFPPLFQQRTYRRTIGNQLLLATTRRYGFATITRNGGVAQLVRRVAAVSSVTEADKQHETEARLDSVAPERRGELRAAFERTEVPDSLPAFRGLFVDELRRVWMQNFQPGPAADSSEWNVFGDDGAPLAEVMLPGRLFPTQAGAAFVVGIQKGPLGQEEVVQLRLLERGR